MVPGRHISTTMMAVLGQGIFGSMVFRAWKTYLQLLYSVSGGHIFYNHVLSGCGEG